MLDEPPVAAAAPLGGEALRRARVALDAGDPDRAISIHLRERLDALAAVLPRLDSVVVLHGQGHLANLRAPGEVAQVIAAFADRLAP